MQTALSIQKFFLLSFFSVLFFFHCAIPSSDATFTPKTEAECNQYGGSCENTFFCSSGRGDVGECGTKNCCVIGKGTTQTEAECNAHGGTCDSSSVLSGDCSDQKISLGACSPISNNKSCCKSVTPATNTTSPTNPTAPTGPTSPATPTSPTSASSSLSSSSASLAYTPLESIPGQGRPTDFPAYIKALYSFGIFSVGIAGLLMVMVGGFYYVTAAGNSSQVEKGKEFIKDALIGVVVAFGSWLILYVINPDLVNINLDSLTKLRMAAGGMTYGPTPGGGSGTPTSNPGNCGGVKTKEGTNGCSLASAELGGMLKCMAEKGVNNYSGEVYSVTSNAKGDNQTASAACCGNSKTAGCPHSNTTCHHGCTMSNKGQSYAVDYMTTSLSDAQICEVAQIAIDCGAADKVYDASSKTYKARIWGPKNMCDGKVAQVSGHENHLHLPTSGCGH